MFSKCSRLAGGIRRFCECLAQAEASRDRPAAGDAVDGGRRHVQQDAADAGRPQAQPVEQRPGHRTGDAIGELIERAARAQMNGTTPSRMPTSLRVDMLSSGRPLTTAPGRALP